MSTFFWVVSTFNLPLHKGVNLGTRKLFQNLSPIKERKSCAKGVNLGTRKLFQNLAPIKERKSCAKGVNLGTRKFFQNLPPMCWIKLGVYRLVLGIEKNCYTWLAHVVVESLSLKRKFGQREDLLHLACPRCYRKFKFAEKIKEIPW